MSKGKRFAKWIVLAATAVIYLSIAIIPFFNTLKTTSNTSPLSKFLGGALTVGEIVVVGILLAILIVLVVLGLKKKDKVKKLIGEYESEVKRITWFPWKDTKKSTVLVLIALVVCAAVISLLDLALVKGILAFIGLFS